jgi:hypothetical protein
MTPMETVVDWRPNRLRKFGASCDSPSCDSQLDKEGEAWNSFFCGYFSGSSLPLLRARRIASGFGWFLIGLFLGPFGLIVAFLPSLKPSEITRAEATGLSNGFRKCPFCAEIIRREAVKCRYCGSDLSSSPPEESVDKNSLGYKAGKAVRKILK